MGDSVPFVLEIIGASTVVVLALIGLACVIATIAADQPTAVPDPKVVGCSVCLSPMTYEHDGWYTCHSCRDERGWI